MATPRILWYEGAMYHITTRGNRRENIFRSDDDFKVYLNILKDSLAFYSHSNYVLVAYCLMSNHVHLIIKTGKEPLASLMRRVNSLYTRYFNKKYEYTGHLFQSRYFSEIITNDRQVLQVSRYVHLNPVKAKIVFKAEDYLWSSYRIFIGNESDKGNLLNSDIVLNYFENGYKYKMYKEFVEQGIPLGPRELPGTSKA